jgi:YVTN family beta-propeller protein
LWRTLVAASVVTLTSAAASAQASPPPFTHFEGGQVRPLALSPDGTRLYATNTPDNRLEIFDVSNGALVHKLSIPVGLEPVAVAPRSNTEVWVVNHLSDSISVVQHDNPVTKGRVARTLLVGDEPRDIVFAGPGKTRAFITTAHRGQNIPFDPQLTTPGVGRADVWVFNANNLGASLGGTPLTIVTLFTDTPRALAVTPDGSKVYAAGFHSGNRTSTIHDLFVPDGGELVGGMPGPLTNHQGIPAPEVSLIVKYDGEHWRDVLGRTQDDKMAFSMPDKDVFVIDAMAEPPAQISGPSGFYQGVGTILYNMAVNPVSGAVYVSNTNAYNMNRFEGPGIYGGSTVRGRFAKSRITVIKAGQVLPRHLNKHVDYSTCCAPIPNAENETSLALPQMMQVSNDGATLYVAALGSSKVGVYSTAELEQDTFVPSVAAQIEVSGGGPTGLALHNAQQRLYVLTRFDNAISVINTATNAEIGHVPMHNPEPAHIVAGRRFLYDASGTSSHGDSACASCHVFGDFDSLAWDLGNPDADVTLNRNTFLSPQHVILPQPFPGRDMIHPMKGPMATQSLRGMANHGPMHWRGDRTGGNDAPSAQPDDGTFDEHAGFMKFQAAITDLLGRSEPLPEEDMAAFADFILELVYPPNPIRALDNSLTPEQLLGQEIFLIPPTCPAMSGASCETCHSLDRQGNEGCVERPGFFGSEGLTVDLLAQSQFLMKVPHFRNLYQKIGRFGFPFHPFLSTSNNEHMGDQVRGVGFMHDGSFDTLFRFHSTPFIFPPGPTGDAQRQAVEKFLLAFDSNLAPIVGQQITLNAGRAALVGSRVNLMIARANAGECDLVAKTLVGANEVGYLYIGAGMFITSRSSDAPVSDIDLRQKTIVTGRDLTYTCAPPGSGVRIGVDRDLDGFYDLDERDLNTDPADPDSHP